MMRNLALLICAGFLSLPALAQSEFHYEFFPGGGGYLGVKLREVEAQDVTRLRLPSETGALVEEVVADSPAAAAGILADDVITSVAGLPILSVSQLQRTIRENPGGRTLGLTVVRAGRTVNLSVQLGESKGRSFEAPLLQFKDLEKLPERSFQWRHEGGPELLFFSDRPRLGVEVTPLTTQMGEFLGAGVEKGLLIQQVESGTPAETAGLRAGDVIAKVDGQAVDSIRGLREALSEGEHQLEIIRNGQRQTVTVQLEGSESKGERIRIR